MANPAYDMVDPIAGSFRARLASPLTASATGGVGPIGVSLNSAGRAVKGDSGGTGIVGVMVKNIARGPVGRWGTGLHSGTPNANAPIGIRAGDVVDIMTAGTIENLDPTAFPAGSKVYVTPAGELSTTATGNYLIGFTRNAGQLIVRFSYGTPAAS